MSTQFIHPPEQHVIKEAIATNISQPILPTVIEQAARTIFEGFSEKLKATLNGRDERALKLALDGSVSHKTARIYSVRSEDGQHAYLVNLDKSFCTCPDHQKGHVCKHRLAAYLIEQACKANQELTPAQSLPSSLPPKNTGQNPAEPDEETLEKARLILQSRSQHLKEAIIYAALLLDGVSVQVEIINLEGEVALVRALPKIKDGQLMPQFHFPERKAVAQVIAKSLSEVRIYR
jgi:hypothetical protein